MAGIEVKRKMRLKADRLLRDRWFVPEAMSHPAKGHLGLWWETFQRYTQPGQWVLDPMAGIGSSLIGALMGRNVICVEKESHFVGPTRQSWAKMRQQVMLGCELGQVLIIQGDARCLPLGRADCVVTSPPYEGIVNDHSEGLGMAGNEQQRRRIAAGSPGELAALSRNKGYTRPAAVITSPPYEESLYGGGDFSEYAKGGDTYAGEGYTRPVDAVVTSPPYERTTSPLTHGPDTMPAEGFKGGWEAAQVIRNGYARTSTNIGNLRGEKYWEAMRLVYGECHRVLAPGGVMVLVVKGYTRDHEYVDLPSQTISCCEALGFRFKERWERELWGLSFWRILQQRRDPAAFDNRLRFESVLVMEKGSL